MYNRTDNEEGGLGLIGTETRRVDLAVPVTRSTRGGRRLGYWPGAGHGPAGPGGRAMRRQFAVAPGATLATRGETGPTEADGLTRGAKDTSDLAGPAEPAEPAEPESAEPESAEPESAEPESAEVRAPASQVTRFLLTAGPIAAADLLGLVAAAALGLAAASGAAALAGSHAPSHVPSWPCVLVLLPLLIAYWQRGLYPSVGLHPVVESRRIIELNTAACLCMAAMTAVVLAAGTAGSAAAGAGASGSARPWLAFLLVAWLASSSLVPAGRALTRKLCARHAWWGYPTVIISRGAAARNMLAALRARPHSGLRPCGVIDPTGDEPDADGLDAADATGAEPTGAEPAEAEPGVDVGGLIPAPHTAVYAVVALPGYPPPQLARVMEAYRSRFPYLLVASDMVGAGLWRDARDCGGGLAGTEVLNQLQLPWPCFLKRAADLVLASAALLLGLPVLAAVAVAVKLSSPGPLFYGQTRLGRRGRAFRAWKFRTMRADADAVLRRLLETDPGARREWERDHKLRKDPRVTRIGELLRRTSLDELPQLWNVVVGEMSLVGPRPIVRAEIAKYGSAYRLYGQVRPGITGLWQVSGRSNTTYRRRVQLDEFYVLNWSPWLDGHILIKTFRAVLRQDGAR